MPCRCQSRSVPRLAASATAHAPPDPSGDRTPSSHFAAVAGPGRLATDQVPPVQSAASGVVPLALFGAEPPAIALPPRSAAGLVRLAPAASVGGDGGRCRPAFGGRRV